MELLPPDVRDTWPTNHRTLAEVARHASIKAIPRSRARSYGNIPVTAVIHHGIDLEIHKPGPGTGGYLLFTGRMSACKGAHHMVRVAQRAGDHRSRPDRVPVLRRGRDERRRRSRGRDRPRAVPCRSRAAVLPGPDGCRL
jgi:glycosyltransferase involved in cell wall biosynthesis